MTSTGVPRISASLSLTESKRSRRANPLGPGVISTAMSTSERFEASPRAVEPNNEIRTIPSFLSSTSWLLRAWMTAVRSIWEPIRLGENAYVRTLSSFSAAAGARLTNSPQPQAPVWFGLVNTNCEESFSVL